MLINHSVIIWYVFFPRIWGISVYGCVMLCLWMGFYFCPLTAMLRPFWWAKTFIFHHVHHIPSSSKAFPLAFSMTFQGLISAWKTGVGFRCWGFHALSCQSELGPKLRVSLWKCHLSGSKILPNLVITLPVRHGIDDPNRNRWFTY